MTFDEEGSWRLFFDRISKRYTLLPGGVGQVVPMPRLYNLHYHKSLRKQLRREVTVAERNLWLFLKNDQFHGLRFRRQFGIGRYIVDFFCPKLRVAIELDGNIHQLHYTKSQDEARQRFLESCFIRVVRFSNAEVLRNIEGVLKKLEVFITSPSVLAGARTVSPF